MFQDASVNPALTSLPKDDEFFHQSQGDDRGDRAAVSNRFSAESYADRLMDDLFKDVDQLLNQDTPQSEFSTGTEQPEPNPEPVRRVPQTVLPLATRPERSAVPPPIEPDSDAALLESSLANISVDKMPPNAAISSLKASLGWLRPPRGLSDRLLFAACCASVVIPLALWLVHKQSQRPQMAVAPASQTAPRAVAEPTNPFADYALRSLQSIDQRSQQGTNQNASGAANNSNLPAVTVPKSTGAAPPPRVSTGLERIYVPVYQLPKNLAPPKPGTAIAPLPNLSTSATPKAVKPGNTARNSSFPPSTSTSSVARRLAGVLTQGDRSVALFETNGVTQRYEIGESIGSSGWTLVEVAQNQAVIRRNGEVRSVFVGQNF